MTNYPGSDWDIINTSVTSTDTEITYNRAIKAFAHRSRNGNTLQLRRQTTDVSFLTIIPGADPDFMVIITNSSATQASLGFIRTEGPTDVVETIVIY